MSMFRVLLIARWFPPEQHSGTLRNEGFARHLPHFGVQPVILTANPVGSDSRSGGVTRTLLQGWKDDPAWAEVRRCEWQGQSTTLTRWLKRLPGAHTWAVRRERRRVVSALLPEARGLVRKHSPRVILASFAPPETVYLGVRLSDEFGIPVIADLRDPWSYAASAPYRHFVDFLLERAEESRLLRQCAHVVVTSNASKRLLVEKIGLSDEMVSVIQNGFDAPEAIDSGGSRQLDTDKFVIVHLGELARDSGPSLTLKKRTKRALGFDYDPLRTDTTARSPRWVLAAAENMIRRAPELTNRLRFWFVGVHDPANCSALTSFPYPECLRIMPRVAASDAFAIAKSADLLLLLQNQYFLDGKDFCVAIAAKTYTYLRAGRPILACLQSSEMADLVTRYSDAKVVAPHDTIGIENALRGFLARNPEPANGRQRSSVQDIDRFSRFNAARDLAFLLKRICEVGRQNDRTIPIPGERVLRS